MKVKIKMKLDWYKISRKFLLNENNKPTSLSEKIKNFHSFIKFISGITIRKRTRRNRVDIVWLVSSSLPTRMDLNPAGQPAGFFLLVAAKRGGRRCAVYSKLAIRSESLGGAHVPKYPCCLQRKRRESGGTARM